MPEPTIAEIREKALLWMRQAQSVVGADVASYHHNQGVAKACFEVLALLDPPPEPPWPIDVNEVVASAEALFRATVFDRKFHGTDPLWYALGIALFGPIEKVLAIKPRPANVVDEKGYEHVPECHQHLFRCVCTHGRPPYDDCVKPRAECERNTA